MINGRYSLVSSRMMKYNLLYLFIILIISSHSRADDEYISVGMTSALTGPLSFIGQNMRDGIDAYFQRINDSGGVNGKQIKLIVQDDKYEPHLAARNMRHLIDVENVIAMIGNVGTPTAVVTVPIANEKKTLLFGAFTGADLLRKFPPDRYVINYRASYREEAATMVDCILALGIKPEEIAFFTQRDGYGDAGYDGAESALKSRGFTSVSSLVHGRYTRNTLNVEGALARLINAPTKPKAVIMAGGYKPSAKFIKLARRQFPELLFFNLSFVGSYALLNVLGDDAENVIVTQVVPDFTSDLEIAREYMTDMNKYKSNVFPGFVSFEGYIVGKIFIEALKKVEGKLSKEKLIDAFYKLNNFDIGLDEKISYSSIKNQAIHRVWPMIVKQGRYKILDAEELRNNLN